MLVVSKMKIVIKMAVVLIVDVTVRHQEAAEQVAEPVEADVVLALADLRA